MFKYLLLFIFLVVFMEVKCSGSSMNYTEIKARLDQGSIALCGQFVYQLSQSRPDENFVTSPTPIMVSLAQIALFAEYGVLKELLSVLNVLSINEIKTVYPQITADYENQQKVEFELGTKYYVNKDYELSNQFIIDSKRYFNASDENIDFSDNQEAAETINDWVSNITRGTIQDLVSADSLDPNAVVVLVNAIYFLGNWVHQFNTKNTEKRDFTKGNGEVVQLDTMYQENSFSYAENIQGLNVQALKMPYKNENFSCLIVLPEEGYYEKTVKALVDPDVFNSIIDSLSYNKVQVYMPKMSIDTNMDMAEMLEEANVTEMFNPNSDGFKGILNDDQRFYVSAAVQKAFMLLDETGTEAGAATALGINTLSLPTNPPPVFKAHPYLFYILFVKSISFCGAFVGQALSLSLTSVIGPTKVYVFNANRSYLFYILYQSVPMFCGAFVGAYN